MTLVRVVMSPVCKAKPRDSMRPYAMHAWARRRPSASSFRHVSQVLLKLCRRCNSFEVLVRRRSWIVGVLVRLSRLSVVRSGPWLHISRSDALAPDVRALVGELDKLLWTTGKHIGTGSQDDGSWLQVLQRVEGLSVRKRVSRRREDLLEDDNAFDVAPVGFNERGRPLIQRTEEQAVFVIER